MIFPSGDTVSDLNEWAAAPPSWKEGRKEGKKSPERASASGGSEWLRGLESEIAARRKDGRGRRAGGGRESDAMAVAAISLAFNVPLPSKVGAPLGALRSRTKRKHSAGLNIPLRWIDSSIPRL